MITPGLQRTCLSDFGRPVCWVGPEQRLRGCYEDQTVREEIFKQILIGYIAPNLQQWTERFPTKFSMEVYRIHGLWGSMTW
jgi:hypothetical protein